MAHRGWHTADLAGLENTLAAFTRAVDEGYAYVETDARAAADGTAVLHHDAGLDRTTTASGPVAARSAAELAHARVGGREPVPTLREALRALPRTRFNVDVKTDDAVPGVLEDLAATDAWDRVCLASFSGRRLARLRAAAGPRLCTALSPAGVLALRVRAVALVDLPHRWLPAGLCAQVPLGPAAAPLVDRRLLLQAHRLGLEVHAWTVDDPRATARLLDLGVDGVITDRPDLLRDLLVARGCWPG
ncbi:glycerophosphodiester phosphodiesterase family protein [Rhodococcus aerolatus]